MLLKTGTLTDIELEKIHTHSEVGYRIMKSIPELSSIADLILSHHEKWDGSGYPRGTKGKRIPYLSRILCIVDAFDMMTNNSIYSPVKSITDAIIELEKCKGTQFDPEIVDQFITMIKLKQK